MAARTSLLAKARARSMAFCRISRLASRSGAMLSAASVISGNLGVGRHVHDENVADAPARSEAAVPLHHRRQQFIGMKAALHQNFAAALAHEPYGLGGGGMAMLCI
jgi:hypothetical protein